MANLIVGVFSDSKQAGNLVGKLKEMDFTDNISVISKQENGEYIDTKTNTIKDQSFLEKDATTTGALMGGLLGLFAGVAAILIPGNILIVGPLATALLGLGGGLTVGALTGMLVDMGVPEDQVSIYSDRINAGDVVVAVEVDEGRAAEVENLMKQYQVVQMEEYRK